MIEMSEKMVATRITRENYSKLLGKCQALGGCSPYEYLRILIETDMMEDTTNVNVDETGINITG